MSFDSTGSSHDFRKIKQNAAAKISNRHLDLLSEMSLDQNQTVVAYADMAHRLDYYDNQFVKQDASDLVKHLLVNLSRHEIRKKLLEQWSYQGSIRKAPRWMLREFLSLWLAQSWQEGYNVEKFVSVPHAIAFCCEDLVKQDWSVLLAKICDALNLQLLETPENIRQNHSVFLQCQIFHGIQQRCEFFVQACIADVAPVTNPCITILDEAFTQSRLRDLGWEIECDGLDVFPPNSKELRRIIYQA